MATNQATVKTKPISQLIALMACLVLCTISATVLVKESSAQAPNSLTYTFDFPEPALSIQHLGNQDYTRISMPGGISLSADIGGPTFPVSFVKLAVPPLTTIDHITVTGRTVPVNTTYNLLATPIIPYQQEMPIGSAPPTELSFNESLYQRSTPYPPNSFDGNFSLGYCRGYTIVSFALTPVQYIPSQGRLQYTPQLTVTLSLRPAAMNRFFRNLAADEDYVSELVSNPDVIASYRSAPFTPTEYPGGLCSPNEWHPYVIITTTQNGLDDWPTNAVTPYNWDSLMNAHIQLCPSEVTVEDINACADYYNATSLFNDTQAHIREFCKDAYEDWRTQYVLIGGDGEWIPARLMAYDGEYDVDADLYWSNLDNTFNADQDNLWGEAGDSGFDLYSELFIGRLTCDTPQDVSNWMTKSFRYANETDPNILDNAAFYAGSLGMPGATIPSTTARSRERTTG